VTLASGRRRALTWLDVFTGTPLAGNGLAVVHDADGLDDAVMARFARETRLSETTFVQTATRPGADYRNRIFMPAREIDFAGHPSLGTAVAVALLRGDDEARYVQETRAGLHTIEVRLDGRVASAAMEQGPATFGAELDAGTVLPAVGLDGTEADPALPCQVVSTGLPHVVAPVAHAGALDRARPSAEGLAAVLDAHGATVLYLAACEPDEGRAHARGFFVQDGLVHEDPATGSAAGPLMAHVHARTGAPTLAIEQGVAMGRPSRLDCLVLGGGRVRVAAQAVVLIEGSIVF